MQIRYFYGFGMDPSNFRWKSKEFRRLLQSFILMCAEAFRTWKSRFFAKCHLDVLKIWFLVDFCRVVIEDFRRFHGLSHISSFLRIVLNVSKHKSHPHAFIFVDFGMDPSNFRMKIHKISALGAKCYRNVARSAPDMKITFFFLQNVTLTCSKHDFS